jgi:hypothetical protein
MMSTEVQLVLAGALLTFVLLLDENWIESSSLAQVAPVFRLAGLLVASLLVLRAALIAIA